MDRHSGWVPQIPEQYRCFFLASRPWSVAQNSSTKSGLPQVLLGLNGQNGPGFCIFKSAFNKLFVSTSLFRLFLKFTLN